MGDNGFGFGEHGLIDKRVAYEWSMRVPMLMQCPDLFEPGTVVEEVVANIDIAPTILEAAGLAPPQRTDGASFLRLATGQPSDWRNTLLYEYYWERNFPQTPTIFALRTDQYKFVRPHGLWNIDELYDIQADPHESSNLIFSAEHQEILQKLKQEMFTTLEESDGMTMPIYADRGGSQNLRECRRFSGCRIPRTPTPARAGRQRPPLMDPAVPSLAHGGRPSP